MTVIALFEHQTSDFLQIRWIYLCISWCW